MLLFFGVRTRGRLGIPPPDPSLERYAAQQDASLSEHSCGPLAGPAAKLFNSPESDNDKRAQVGS
jgi:hypothetical protein